LRRLLAEFHSTLCAVSKLSFVFFAPVAGRELNFTLSLAGICNAVDS
jgi:hypothetical protein